MIERLLLLSGILAHTTAGYAQAGQLDSDFNADGLVLTAPFGTQANSTMHIKDMALQPDGKIVVVGAGSALTSSPQGTDIVTARYLPDGTLDLGFGGGDGYALTDLGDGNDHAEAVAVRPDGRIIIVGSGSYDVSETGSDVVVKCLLPSGATDLPFGASSPFDMNGTVNVDVGGGQQFCRDLIVQSNNKIIVAGTTSISGDSDFMVFRLNPDGSLDPTFSSDGIVTTSYGTSTYESIEAIVEVADGNVLATGSGSGGILMMRYLSNGALDVGFDSDGKALFPSPPNPVSLYPTTITVSDMTLDAQERPVVVGSVSYMISMGTIDTPDIYGSFGFLFRCLANGSPDPAFGTNGYVIIEKGGVSVHEQPDGTLLVGGYDGATDMVLRHFLPNGSLDPAFGTAGRVNIDFNGASDYTSCMLVQPDHRILLAGHTDFQGEIRNQFALARLLNDPEIGMEELSAIHDLKIHPNPVADVLHLTIRLDEPGVVTAELLDLHGRVVQVRSRINTTTGEQCETMDMQHLAPGTYLLRLLDPKGVVVTKRIIRS